MNVMRARSIGSILALVVLLTGCSASASVTTPSATSSAGAGSAATPAPGASGDFCAAYEAAGGDVETPGVFNFEAGTTETLNLLQDIKKIQGSVTPPTEIQSSWGQWVDLTDQAITVVNALPESDAISDPQVKQISESMLMPTMEIRQYLAENCG